MVSIPVSIVGVTQTLSRQRMSEVVAVILLHPEICYSSVCFLFAEANQLEISLMMSSCVNYMSKILHCVEIPAPRFSIKHWHDLNVFSWLFRWIIKILWPTFLLLVNTLKD